MPDPLLRRMWTRVAGWFAAHADHVTVRFLPDDAGRPIHPHAGYLRLWLAEGFLARQRTWGASTFPALHGGVSLGHLGGDPTTFTSFGRPPEHWTSPGARLDFPLTPLLPFRGGTVEVEAALYEARADGPLGIAVDLLGGLASLMGPPLSVAAAVADKVSEGLDAVLSAAGADPVLALHATMVAPGGGGTELRAGHVVVLAAPEPELGGIPVIVDGRLHLRSGDTTVPPTGVDYIVVRVECRTERDDWRFPELDALILAAGAALVRGHRDAFADLRTDAITRAWNSTDLTSADRGRVALLVKDELDALGDLGVVPRASRAIHEIVDSRLPDRDDPRLGGMSLGALLDR